MSLAEKLALADVIVAAVGFAIFRSLATREILKQQPDKVLAAVALKWNLGATGKGRLFRNLAFAWMIICFLAGLLLMTLFADK